MMYNDILGKGIEEYWKNEGCNSRMQKYYKTSVVLKSFNNILKYLMIFVLIIISILTIFKLSTGLYYEDITGGEKGLLLVMDIIPKLMAIIIAGQVAYIISIRFDLLKDKSIEHYMFKFIIAIPLYYLILIYMSKMDGLLLISILVIFYLLIVNLNHLLMNRIIYLYNISTGNNKQKNEVEEKDVDVVFEAVLKNRDKKEKEKKRNARKR